MVYGPDYATTIIGKKPDPNIRLSVNDVKTTEGDEGITPVNFIISLTEALADPIVVHYGTVDDSAEGEKDYKSTQGSITFAPGETQKSVTVDVIGDKLPEETETFKLEVDTESDDIVGLLRKYNLKVE